jgi:hypothetical protein
MKSLRDSSLRDAMLQARALRVGRGRWAAMSVICISAADGDDLCDTLSMQQQQHISCRHSIATSPVVRPPKTQVKATDLPSQISHHNASSPPLPTSSSSSTAHLIGSRVNEKVKKPWRWQTSKNCPAEAPEGDSNQDLSALCNAADPD